MAISIIIKALNEERKIAEAVESALVAIGGQDGEVILADSGSTDRTVEIASRYPIRIVQLADVTERKCGIGPQLGFQHATGDYVCLIDGDMQLDARFIEAAIDFLMQNPRVGGVAGLIQENSLESLEYARRAQRNAADLQAGVVDRLNGGGLYRREAIVKAGYISDRNLHAYEEFDLASRLQAAGWTLYRLPVRFVQHTGHKIGAYQLLWRRLRSRYVFGSGEIFRSALAGGRAKAVLSKLPEIRLWIAVVALWAAMAASVILASSWVQAGLAVAVLASLPAIVMTLRCRSLVMGLYSATAWHVHALGFALGLLQPRKDPRAPIASRILHDRTSERVHPRRVGIPNPSRPGDRAA